MGRAMSSKRINILFVAILVILLPLFGFFAYRVYINEEINSRVVSLQKRKDNWANLSRVLVNKVMNFRGNASIVIKDLDMDWEIAFNKDKPIPAASLVKLPILLSFYYADQEGKLRLSDALDLTYPEKTVAGDTPNGSISSVEELLNPMITYSDNVATNTLIDLLGYDSLNEYFKKIGLKNTSLSRKMLDFNLRGQGVENYTTAQDMAYLLEILYRGSFVNKEVSNKCLDLLMQQKINDRIPKKLPKDIPIAHKTGLENHICHDVGIVYTEKGDFIICVLVKHGDRYAKPAKEFIADIALLTYRYYQSLE